MKRHVIMFQPQFAAKVRSGEKRQTIRPERKRPIAARDMLDLRAWSGLPYRSKQVSLTGARACKQVGTVELTPLDIILDGIRMIPEEAVRFAQADGFSDAIEMLLWFDKTHGLPFKGVLIRW